MGRNNQRRRADKKRRDERRPAGSGRSSGSWRALGGELLGRRAENLVFAGALAAARGLAGEVEVAVDGLAGCARAMPPASVTAIMGSALCAALAGKWEDGWQPVELWRMARRQRSAHHAELLGSALAAPECWDCAGGAAMPEDWTDQLAQLGVARLGRDGEDWVQAWVAAQATTGSGFAAVATVVLEAMGVLLSLPPIEALLPRPSEWATARARVGGPATDDPVLVTVRALLAKAESTNFEAESEAFTAKAQQLMARHAIDEAVARQARSSREAPVTRRIAVDDPYASAKSQLLAVVAGSNDVRCVWYEQFAMMAVVGFASDLDAVEVLFTSLLVQASRAMLARGKVRDQRGRSRTRSFRQSFVVAFAHRIAERLDAAAAAARTQAEAELSTSLAPVLASRAREIDDAVTRIFPHTRRLDGPAVTNAEGWQAGRTAAELATLGPLQGMLDGMVSAG